MLASTAAPISSARRGARSTGDRTRGEDDIICTTPHRETQIWYMKTPPHRRRRCWGRAGRRRQSSRIDMAHQQRQRFRPRKIAAIVCTTSGPVEAATLAKGRRRAFKRRVRVGRNGGRGGALLATRGEFMTALISVCLLRLQFQFSSGALAVRQELPRQENGVNLDRPACTSPRAARSGMITGASVPMIGIGVQQGAGQFPGAVDDDWVMRQAVIADVDDEGSAYHFSVNVPQRRARSFADGWLVQIPTRRASIHSVELRTVVPSLLTRKGPAPIRGRGDRTAQVTGSRDTLVRGHREFSWANRVQQIPHCGRSLTPTP